MYNQYTQSPTPLESDAQGLDCWRGNMDPFKFPPRNQSLLALGMSLACGCHLGGGVERSLGLGGGICGFC